MKRKKLLRHEEVRRMRVQLELEESPRLQMCLIVFITGFVGFVASFSLLHAGLGEMSMRYPLAVAVAYTVFLLFLGLWLRGRADDHHDIPDLFSGLPSSNSSGGTGDVPFSGGGGDSGGGGAGGSFDGPADGVMTASDSGTPVGEALEAAAQAEEFAIPLVVLVLLGAILLSSFYVVYSAPVLFAELLVDGVLSASLYRKMRGLETRHWLETAVRRTFWPFVITALIAGLAGWGMSVYAPGAKSIGAVLMQRAN